MAEPIAVTVPAAVVAAEVAKAPAAISLAGYAMLAFGVVIIAVLIIIFVRAQWDTHNRIDLTDLLLDQATGKTSQGRFWGLIGGAAGTWVFIYLPVSGHFDATYASAYLLAAFGLKVAGDITGKPQSGDSSVTTTTTTAVSAAAPLAAAQPARGSVEPLSPKIGPEDVGKSVAIVRTGRKKPKPKRGRR